MRTKIKTKSQYKSTVLAVNLFRVIQTAEKLNDENVRDSAEANSIHYAVGLKARKAMEEIGNTLAENMPVMESIILQQKRDKKMPSENNRKKKTAVSTR